MSNIIHFQTKFQVGWGDRPTHRHSYRQPIELLTLEQQTCKLNSFIRQVIWTFFKLRNINFGNGGNTQNDTPEKNPKQEKN